ncbi:arylalkylamine N-acetyltransferase 1 isoform X2 [Halyomorpha halys]|uniref:arylalkylamine N-acetyltransferase 1 isoform X2 n=1 Tax=Halyomorpha halys TaxID=286706 RepID=UPI0006D51157|nr:uncharacterized protein LOC106692849 [Halyomorpha halys]
MSIYTQMDGWRIERATMDDKQEIYDLLVKTFYLDEPASKDLFALYGVPPIDDSLGMQALPHGMSFKAVSEDGKIFGVVLNMDHSQLKDFNPKPHKAMEKLGPFFDIIDKKAGSLKGFLGLHIVAVDNSWRKRGVAERLVAEAEEESSRKGYKGLEVVCTSAYSSRLMAKRGYEHILRYPYASYTDADGNQVFNPPPPHDAVNVYIKRNVLYLPPTNEDSEPATDNLNIIDYNNASADCNTIKELCV